MKLFQKYNSLPNYLDRFTVLKLFRLHIRIHHITSADDTPFLHTHPFNFISVIFRGGYIEQLLVGDSIKTIKHKAISIIVRNHTQYHRIQYSKNCKTFFISWYLSKSWDLKLHSNIKASDKYVMPSDGIHTRIINGKELYCKASNGIWYIGNKDIQIAKAESRYSIHQSLSE